MQDFEKLGAFYLGRLQEEPGGEPTDEPLLYDAKDLTTHAVCVGMTGSGKTGLGIGLLEEAAIDGIPAIVIDPKGDMGNLLLTFPELAPADFAPWIDPDEAKRQGLEPAAFAERTASTWRQGLAEWGQDGARIRRLREAVEIRLFTPGSSVARPISALRSFEAPPAALRADVEALRERVQGSVAGLLALLGIDADPIQSREAILLANIVQGAWNEGRDLDLAELIRAIQDPPFERLGVLDVDSFFPPKERFALAMSLNNLLASPGFAAWMEGEPLDVQRLLWSAAGKPRVSILSIAHLSDSERMFFVTLLLGEVLAWMRTQPGTGSLRALLYMDEVFGYFPPSKEPPSKKPMLTLLKQARAFGLGIVLATQNPVDLDYKGLSNAGTWFLGRLQTERDKLRVLDGLEGAMRGGGRSFDRAEIDAILSGLGKRVFLMNNVHDERPVLFRTRWVLSYLRGPLTRDQLRSLRDDGEPAAAREPEVAAAGPPASAAPVAGEQAAAERVLVPPDVEERFLAVRWKASGGGRLVYRPGLLARARVHYANARARIDVWEELTVLVPLASQEDEPLWEELCCVTEREPRLDDAPAAGASFAAPPSAALQAKSYGRWAKELEGRLYRERHLVLYKSPEHKLVSHHGETEGDFRVRVGHAAREERDERVEKLEKRYESRLRSARERIRKAQERLGKQEQQLGQQKKQGWISMGSSLLGALFSRKLESAGNVGRVSSAARSMGRTAKERADVERAERDLAAEREKLAELEAELASEIAATREQYHPDRVVVEESIVTPRKSDLDVSEARLGWAPWREGGQKSEPAFEL